MNAEGDDASGGGGSDGGGGGSGDGGGGKDEDGASLDELLDEAAKGVQDMAAYL